jgi:hypothetical protein
MGEENSICFRRASSAPCDPIVTKSASDPKLHAETQSDGRSFPVAFAANAVRLQLHALAYNLGNFLRTLATPEPIKDWSLKEKLIKVGAKVIIHGRYVAFLMAEVAIPRNLSADILRLIAELRPLPVTSTV